MSHPADNGIPTRRVSQTRRVSPTRRQNQLDPQLDPPVSIQSIVNLLRFSVRSVEDLLIAANKSLHWADAVNNYSPAIWTKILTHDYITHSFEIGDDYIVTMALLARMWYLKETTPKQNPIPQVANYNYYSKFAVNKYPSIDELMVEFGFIDYVDDGTFAKEDNSNVNNTPMYVACIARNYKKIAFLLKNNFRYRVDYNLVTSFSYDPFSAMLEIMSDEEYKNPQFLFVIKLYLLKGKDLRVLIPYTYRNIDLLRLVIADPKFKINERFSIEEDLEYVEYEEDSENSENSETLFLYLAGQVYNPEFLKVLLANGANINDKYDSEVRNANALDVAIQDGYESLKVSTFLLESGIEILNPQDMGYNLVVIMKQISDSTYSDTESDINNFISALIKRGVDIFYAIDEEDNPFMHLNFESTFHILFAEMRRRNADIINGAPELAIYYRKKRFDLIKLFIDNGSTLYAIYYKVDRRNDALDKEIDDYIIGKFHLDSDALAPHLSTNKLVKYFNDRDISMDVFLYILATKNDDVIRDLI